MVVNCLLWGRIIANRVSDLPCALPCDAHLCLSSWCPERTRINTFGYSPSHFAREHMLVGSLAPSARTLCCKTASLPCCWTWHGNFGCGAGAAQFSNLYQLLVRNGNTQSRTDQVAEWPTGRPSAPDAHEHVDTSRNDTCLVRRRCGGGRGGLRRRGG